MQLLVAENLCTSLRCTCRWLSFTSAPRSQEGIEKQLVSPASPSTVLPATTNPEEAPSRGCLWGPFPMPSSHALPYLPPFPIHILLCSHVCPSPTCQSLPIPFFKFFEVFNILQPEKPMSATCHKMGDILAPPTHRCRHIPWT